MTDRYWKQQSVHCIVFHIVYHIVYNIVYYIVYYIVYSHCLSTKHEYGFESHSLQQMFFVFTRAFSTSEVNGRSHTAWIHRHRRINVMRQKTPWAVPWPRPGCPTQGGHHHASWPLWWDGDGDAADKGSKSHGERQEFPIRVSSLRSVCGQHYTHGPSRSPPHMWSLFQSEGRTPLCESVWLCVSRVQWACGQQRGDRANRRPTCGNRFYVTDGAVSKKTRCHAHSSPVCSTVVWSSQTCGRIAVTHDTPWGKGGQKKHWHVPDKRAKKKRTWNRKTLRLL